MGPMGTRRKQVKSMIRTLRALALAAALALILSTPIWAEDTTSIRFSDLCFPGTVQSISGDTVTLDVNGTSVMLPSSLGRFEVNGNTVVASNLKVGDTAIFYLPAFSGTLQSTSGGFLTVNSNGRNIMLPITAIHSDVLASNNVYVRLHNGNIVQVPLTAALNMQYLQNATILSSLPAGSTVMTMGQALPVSCHRMGMKTVNVINNTVISTDVDDGTFNEVPNLEGLDNGSGNFDEPTGGFDRIGPDVRR